MRQLAEFIKQGENFAVISHISPDGDTMGSAAALLYAQGLRLKTRSVQRL